MTEHRLASILAMDVVGYSAMMQNDADQVIAALNQMYRAAIRPPVRRYGGRVVKLMGDGALVEFASAQDAVLCACDIQTRMRADPAPYTYPRRLNIRIGIHAGDITVSQGDVFGEAVNIAARLESAAPPGGVLVSKMVADLAGGNLPVNFHDEGMRRLKNIDMPVQVLRVEEDKADGEASEHTDIVRFCQCSDGVNLAWAATGQGPPLVRAPAWISRIDLDRRLPHLPHFFDYFSRDHTLIRFDGRGNGLSDREFPGITFERMVDDLRAIFDAAGVERAPILGMSQGCAIAAAFAERYPHRVSSIIMIGGFAQGRGRRPAQKDRDLAAALQAMMRAGWDDDYPSLRDMFAEMVTPLASLEDRRYFAKAMREIATPDVMGAYREVVDNIDVTRILPQVDVPCLVMHCDGDRMHPIDQGRLLASLLPKARFVALESCNHIPTANDPCWPRIQDEVTNFLRDPQTTGQFADAALLAEGRVG